VSNRPALLPILVLAAAICATGASGASGVETTPQQNAVAIAAEMMISAGRLGVMLDHAEAGMKLPPGIQAEEPLETTAQQQLYVVHELRAAVLRYNTLLFDACRGGLLSGELCARPYFPDWLKEGPDNVPPTPVLAGRVQDAVGYILPFWRAMCARAVAQTRDDTFCAIE
jgi:hypothetical protein